MADHRPDHPGGDHNIHIRLNEADPSHAGTVVALSKKNVQEFVEIGTAVPISQLVAYLESQGMHIKQIEEMYLIRTNHPGFCLYQGGVLRCYP